MKQEAVQWFCLILVSFKEVPLFGFPERRELQAEKQNFFSAVKLKPTPKIS